MYHTCLYHQRYVSGLMDTSAVSVLLFSSQSGMLLLTWQKDLGAASNTKRPTSCVLISTKTDFEYRSKTEDIIKEVKKLSIP